MTPRIAVLAATLIGVGSLSLPAATSMMPIDEIRPGMSGVGITVFDGARREEFKAQIIGVLKNVVGPRRNLILARLDGGPLAQTGVIQGMSGSPVYIDGRLVGAVSYSLGSFAKEPLAGITPIGEMTEAVALPATRPPISQKARLEFPVTPEGFAAALRDAFAQVRPFADSPTDIQALGLPHATGGQLGAMLRPIATPLVMGGFGAEVMDLLSSTLRNHGFVPVVSGAAAGAPPADELLQPGDPIAVGLISGDLMMAGTGTVTHVDGQRVYAFGHPFFNLGPTQFPMNRAYVHALLPSLLTSVKILSVGEVIGTFQQDRATGIGGTLGPGPKLIPVSVTLDSAHRGQRERFSYQVAHDQLFTPLLTYAVILNTLRSYEREFGAATFGVRGKASLKGQAELTFDDIFTGDGASVGAATYIAGPLTALLANDVKPVEIDAIELSIGSAEQPRLATLERVWLDEVRPRAGQTVPLKIVTRTYRGNESTRTVPIQIPANAAGSLRVMVSDGLRLTQWEQRELRQPGQPQSVEQMVRTINNARKNNRLYIRLLRADAGAVINGETLTALPPSVLAVLEADRNGGNFIPLRNATIGEWEIATEHAVRGSKLLSIIVDAR